MTATHPATVSLLAVDPDLARFLTDKDRAEIGHPAVPVEVLPKGPVDIGAVLSHEGGFGALVLDGMLVHRLEISDQIAMRLIGPGDFLFVSGSPRSMLVGESSCRATVSTRVAILGDETLAAVQRWPLLAAGLSVRIAEQSDRLAVQLAICQLPRVDQRILSLLWLLAEAWGHVGPAGTVLPVSLTHDALGALIGARRPTVTLALGELSDRGAIVRQDGGWLLLEQPPAVSSSVEPRNDEPALLDYRDTTWRSRAIEERDDDSRRHLFRTVEGLRQQHAWTREDIHDHLAELRRSRERCAEVRRRIAEKQVTRPAP